VAQPIRNCVGSVFLHVTDMERAIDWYSRLFGVPSGDTSHEGLIYEVPTDGDTGLILDGHAHAGGEWTPPPTRPACMLAADDIHAAHQFALKHATDVSEIEDIGSVSVFQLADPDGNRLVVFARND